MVASARDNSPYYRKRCRDVPVACEDPSLMPVTTKKDLMAAFDDWATDREVTIERVSAHLGNLDLIGAPLLGKYTVATTSGTTGTPGIFLLDSRALAVTTALIVKMGSAWMSVGQVLRIAVRGGRTTIVCATGGHHAEIVFATQLRKGSQRRVRAIQVLPAHLPIADMVTELNRFRPAILAPYAGIGSLLSDEQAAGRLQIAPFLVALSAEGLPPGAHAKITQAFGVRARHSYAATECTFLSSSCGHDWLHVNSDWVLIEPVDAEDRPVPADELSHTALLSNLAKNRVQPILRYALISSGANGTACGGQPMSRSRGCSPNTGSRT